MLAAEVAQLDELAADAPEQLLAGRLGAEPVLLIVAGDVDGGVVDGVARSLAAATSSFVGELRIDPAVFDPANAGRVAEEIGVLDLVDVPAEPTASEADAVATAFGERIGVLLDQVASSAPALADETSATDDSSGGELRRATADTEVSVADSDASQPTGASDSTAASVPPTADPDSTEPEATVPETTEPETTEPETTEPETTEPETTEPDDAPPPTRGIGDALRAAFGGLEDAGVVDLLRMNPTPIRGERLGVVVLTDRNLSHDPSAVLRPMMTAPEARTATTIWLVAEVGRIEQDNDDPTPSFVTAIRDSGRLRDEFSTVDNAETILGWIAIVLGLAAAERGEVGQYGFRAGAQAAIPRSS